MLFRTSVCLLEEERGGETARTPSGIATMVPGVAHSSHAVLPVACLFSGGVVVRQPSVSYKNCKGSACSNQRLMCSIVEAVEW